MYGGNVPPVSVPQCISSAKWLFSRWSLHLYPYKYKYNMQILLISGEFVYLPAHGIPISTDGYQVLNEEALMCRCSGKVI